ncbi:response regulator transcription factor, partial [Streptomyces adustus]|nr:response regulator transcription factor [Streptomyces adustus]
AGAAGVTGTAGTSGVPGVTRTPGTARVMAATGTTGTAQVTGAEGTTEALEAAGDSGVRKDLRASGTTEALRASEASEVAEATEALRVAEESGGAEGADGDGPAPGFLDRLPARTGGPALTVRATLVRAQAADRAGDAAAAQRLVGEALREARRECLRRPFIEAGPWIRPLLGTPANRELGRGWLTVRQGPHAAPARPAAPAHADAEQGAPVVERLSARERDVLQRLAQVMSTEEIAADLYLSVNTVKTHLKNVYRKLSVNRRGDALRRARELGML